MTYVIVVVLLVGVVVVLSGPLRRPLGPQTPDAGERQPDPGPSEELIELEAARDAKYREIRDAELDHQTGKLSDDDFAAIDAALRAEAIEILRNLDRVQARDGGQRPEPGE